MQKTAIYWLVYTLSHSVFLTCFAVFLIQFPSFIFSPYESIVLAKYGRYKALLITQIAFIIQTSILTLVVLLVNYSVWHILFLSTIFGIITAFDAPARQSMAYALATDKKDISTVLSLNSSMANLAKVIGPAVSGILLDNWSASLCFALNAAGFIIVIVSLLFIKQPIHTNKRLQKSSMDFMTGFVFLKRSPSMAGVILLLACSSLLALPYASILPVFTIEALHDKASAYGYLMGFSGLGAIVCSIFLASLKSDKHLKRLLVLATFFLGMVLILFSYAPNFLIALFLIALIGFGTAALITLVNTIIQTSTSDETRSSLLNYYTIAFFGIQPLGALFVGMVSSYMTTSSILLVEGFISIELALFFWPYLWKETKKPIKNLSV
jgi:MFS family permease